MNNREHAPIARFGRFLLNSHRRELLADGVPVPVGSRAFDVLAVLVEARGQIVTKDELASRVWPGRFIEDNCLQFQISALRKALSADRDFIKTIPGRGYCFIADVATYDEPGVVSVTPRHEALLSTGAEATSAGCSDLVAALRLAARVDVGGIDESRPGMESQVRALPATLQLAEDGWDSSGVGTAPGPKRLFLLLSIDPAVLGRQDRAVRTQETLPV